MDSRLVRRRALRAASTDAQAALWRLLRAPRFARFKFRRQHPCGPYVLDFYCLRKRVAVELDGGQDFDVEAERYDERRTAFLGRRGITVLRFSSELIFREIDGVQEVILAALGGADPSP